VLGVLRGGRAGGALKTNPQEAPLQRAATSAAPPAARARTGVGVDVGAVRRDGAQLDGQRVELPRGLKVAQRRAVAARAVPVGPPGAYEARRQVEPQVLLLALVPWGVWAGFRGGWRVGQPVRRARALDAPRAGRTEGEPNTRASARSARPQEADGGGTRRRARAPARPSRRSASPWGWGSACGWRAAAAAPWRTWASV